MVRTLFAVLAVCAAISVFAQSNHIDTIRHDAPALARFGEYDIGVRTLKLTDRNRPDIVNTLEGGETTTYDRRLIVEKGNKESLTYLRLIPNSQDGVYSVENEHETDEHTYWKGFAKDTARGLVLEHLGPNE